MDILLILFIWLVAPFAELGAIIFLYVANDNKKKKIDMLSKELEWRRQGMSGPSELELYSTPGPQRAPIPEPQHKSNPERRPGSENNPVISQTPENAKWAAPVQDCAEQKASGIEIGHVGTRLDGGSQTSSQALAQPDTSGMPGSNPISGASGTPGSNPACGASGLPGSNPAYSAPGTPGSNPACSASGIPGQNPAYDAPRDPGTNTAGKKRRNEHSAKNSLYQGTTALIIGVVFVVLSGLIFATTTWHVLPSICKVFIVLAFAVLFFGASVMAERIFRIRRTARAFYILGSVFLFLTVLAAGYFGIMGSGFVLNDEHRFRVLWVGSIVTECAMFMGLKKFEDKVYTQACLLGLTISMIFLVNAFHVSFSGFVNIMTYYATALLACREALRRSGVRNGESGTAAPYKLGVSMETFAPVHFLLFSALMILRVFLGLFGVVTGLGWIDDFGVTAWSVLGMACVAAGVTMEALRNESLTLKAASSFSWALFFHYAVFVVSAAFEYQLLAAEILTGLLFIIGRKRLLVLSGKPSDLCYSIFIGFDTLVLSLMALVFRDEIGAQAAASAAVLIFSAVLCWWGREYKATRCFLPAVLFMLTFTFHTVCSVGFKLAVSYETVAFLYLIIVAVWDIVKKENFCVPLLALGTALQLLFWLEGGASMPIFYLLAAFLAAKAKGEAEASYCYIKGACVYALAGTYILADSAALNSVLKMSSVLAVYAGCYGAVVCRDKGKYQDVFWDILGTALFLLLMSGFYQDKGQGLWTVALCLGEYAVFYVLFYLGGRFWPLLLIALAVLPVPAVLDIRYGLSDNALYGSVAAFYLLTGFCARRYRPICEKLEDLPAKWRLDWHHLLAGAVLCPMTLTANHCWRSVYLALAALYVLQFITIQILRKWAFTAAGILVSLAFWLQDFVAWPQLIALEVKLIPAALFIFVLPRIWGETESLTDFQTILYCLCLGALAVDALISGNVWDALILELACLCIFFWAHAGKCRRWIRISGFLIISVALYVTKDFWLSISWWIYLLAAGLGLIIFAAVNEMKKR